MVRVRRGKPAFVVHVWDPSLPMHARRNRPMVVVPPATYVWVEPARISRRLTFALAKGRLGFVVQLLHVSLAIVLRLTLQMVAPLTTSMASVLGAPSVKTVCVLTKRVRAGDTFVLKVHFATAKVSACRIHVNPFIPMVSVKIPH